MTQPGIVVALDAERRTLTTHPVPPESCARLPSGAFVAVGGVGPERARAAARRLLDAGATALVSWGVAAGLDPGLASGCLVLPQRVLAATGDAYDVAASWHAVFTGRWARAGAVSLGLLLEASGLLETPAEKRALFEQHGAVAADMESAAVARMAAERSVPFVVVRAVADPAGGRAPRWVSGLLDPGGGVRVGRAARQALAHPGDFGALLALARQFRAARRTLRRAAVLLFSELV